MYIVLYVMGPEMYTCLFSRSKSVVLDGYSVALNYSTNPHVMDEVHTLSLAFANKHTTV